MYFKVSDLQKYDREKVIKSFDTVASESAKIQMSKLFNWNMYRVIDIIIFGDTAYKAFKIT